MPIAWPVFSNEEREPFVAVRLSVKAGKTT